METYEIWFCTLRKGKVKAETDHGKKLRSYLAASLGRMAHSYLCDRDLEIGPSTFYRSLVQIAVFMVSKVLGSETGLKYGTQTLCFTQQESFNQRKIAHETEKNVH